jgi:GWxTD domain-containing protein
MTNPKTRWVRITASWLLAAWLFVLTGAAAAASKTSQLDPVYKKWLEQDVVYIISKTEREIFLGLKTNIDRDRFIQLFWDARDPTPGTPQNEFKDEHYRRIEYANAHFAEGTGPGWKTDRGRIYIQLGPPAQILDWLNDYEIYPVIMWFYSVRNHPSLTNNFYLLFWQREGAGGFKLYSPYNDGPEKLVHATFGGRQQSYDYLRSVNGELARATLTYYPNEPVDYDQLQASLTSDLLVASIWRLPEEEAPTSYLQQFLPANSKLAEKVQTKYSYQFLPMQAACLPVTDAHGNTLIHYAFYISPENLSIARYKEQFYAALEISVDLSTGKNQTVLHQSQNFVQYYSESDLEKVKYQPLVFEDKIGAVPGQYQMTILVYNKITSQSYRFEKAVEIPEIPAVAPAIGPLMPMENVQPAPTGVISLRSLIFTFFGYSFSPLVERTLHPSEKLNVMYQLYYPPDKARQESNESLDVEYRFLNVGGAGTPAKVITDTLSKGQFNAMGCLLTYKQLAMEQMANGRYTLVVAVKEPSGRMIASNNLAFTLDASKRRVAARDYASEQLAADDAGLYEYQRGMILLNLDKKTEAIERLRAATLRSPALTPAAVALARLELEQGNSAQSVTLLERVRGNKDFPVGNMLLLGKAYAAAGRNEDADRTLAEFLRLVQPSRTEYQELAVVFEHLGKPEKAAEMRKSAEALAPAKEQNIKD